MKNEINIFYYYILFFKIKIPVKTGILIGARDGNRTRDLFLGKEAFYH